MNSTNKDYREQYILYPGDVIQVGNTDYTITDDFTAYGGSAAVYSARSSEDQIDYVIKEVFPNKTGRFKRENGIVCAAYPNDRRSRNMLDKYRAKLVQEQIIGSRCFNSTILAVPVRRIIQPDSVTINGQRFTDVKHSPFAVLDSMRKKSMSFAKVLEEIRQEKSEDHPLRTGGCPTLYTTACLMERVLLTLQTIHRQNVLFGDLHMDNVLFSECHLEEKRVGVACFLDFGCARELIDGKKTAVINDDILSTEGFIPPELLNNNDGTLQLTRQADIFSAGCLMLRCLVPEEDWDYLGSSLEIDSVAILPSDAKRLGIGERLRQYINRILAKSMAAEPTMRYADATAMLLDILHLKDCCAPVLSWENGLTSDILACAVERRWKASEISLSVTNNEDNRAYINILSNAKEVIVFADEDGRAFSFQEIVENNSVPMYYCVDMFPLPSRNNLLYYLIRNNISSAEMVPLYLTRPVSSKKIALHELSKLIAKQYLNSATNETIDAVSQVLTSPQAHKLLCIVDTGSSWFHIVTPITDTDPISMQKLTCQCKNYSSILQLSNQLIDNKMYSLAKEWLEIARAKGFADATNRLGELYLYGLGGKPDPAMAWDLFEEAINKEHGSKASAYVHMGDMLMGSEYDPNHEVLQNPWFAWMHYRYARILGYSGIDERINAARSATDRELTLLLICGELERMGAFFLVPSDYRCYHIKSRYYSKIAAMLEQGDSMEWVGKVHGLSASEINRILQCNKIGELKEQGYSAEMISEELQIPVDDVYIEIHGIMNTLWTFRVRRN